MGGISRRGLGVVVLALLMLAPASAAGAVVAGADGGAATVPLEPVPIGAPGLIVTHGGDVADPFLLKVGSSYLLFSSQFNFYEEHIPLRVSSSLTDWNTPAIDAMPTLPVWANDGFTWGPDVRRVGSHYVLWFSAPLRSSGNTLTKCIGVAVSRSPYGPYQPGTEPLICQLNHLGSIDPRSFVDQEGRLWLTWKSDDNADVNGTAHSTIWVQRVSRNGLGLVGSALPLLTADQPWEGRIVEAPDMVYESGHYWLFYSGNWFNQAAYAIGVAECAGPTGPCIKPLDQPWLASNEQGFGPGEESVFTDAQGSWLLYSPFAVNYETRTNRPVAMLRVAFDQFGPYAMPPQAPASRPLTPRSRTRVIAPLTPGLGPIPDAPTLRTGGLQANG